MKTCSRCGESKEFSFFGKLSKSSDGYRPICKECRKGEHTERYKNNKEEWNKRAVAWQKQNPERMKQIWKTHRDSHKEERSNYKKDWIEKNRSHVNSYNMSRHAEKLQRTPKWLTADDLLKIESMYELATEKAKETGHTWHVDHIVPLRGKQVNGLHVPWNLQVIPATENLRKYNTYDG